MITRFPQGSRLGPILCILHINDLPKNTLRSIGNIYVDAKSVLYKPLACPGPSR